MSDPAVVEFASDAGPLALTPRHLPAGESDELAFVAAPETYERILDRRLFGVIPENLPQISPLRSGEPVTLTLRRRVDAPEPADGVVLDAADWQLTSVTQDFEGVEVGYRTVGADDELSLAVMDFMAGAGWTASRIAPDDPFVTVYPGENGDLDVAIHTDEQRRFLLALATLPVAVPADRLAAVSELALRISAAMDIGSIDVDLDRGAVAVRSSADFDGVAVTAAMVRNVLAAAVAQGDRYLPAFSAVALGASVPDAIAAIG